MNSATTNFVKLTTGLLLTAALGAVSIHFGWVGKSANDVSALRAERLTNIDAPQLGDNTPSSAPAPQSAHSANLDIAQAPTDAPTAPAVTHQPEIAAHSAQDAPQARTTQTRTPTPPVPDTSLNSDLTTGDEVESKNVLAQRAASGDENQDAPQTQERPQERPQERSGASTANEACLNTLERLTAGNAIQFQFGSARYRNGSGVFIDQLAALLVACPAIAVDITGHTDTSGAPSHNLALSRARASAVASALRARGVGRARTSFSGVGDAQPIASNATRAGRVRNRRIEFSFSLQSPQ